MYGVFAREKNYLAGRSGKPSGANWACGVEVSHSARMILFRLDGYTCIAVFAMDVIDA